MTTGNYHAAQSTPPATPLPYWVWFTSAPPQYAFILDKTPRCATLHDAFMLLRHYEFEFDVGGYVCSKFGIEPEPIPVYEVLEDGFSINVDDDVPQ